RDEMERRPMAFFVRELEERLDAVRELTGRFVGADPDGLVFAPNATTGINAVLRSLKVEPGDELLTTTHEYNASRNTLVFVAERSNAKVVDVEIPFPAESEEECLDRILAAVTDRTTYALLDHVTSPTALVFPMERIVRELKDRGVETLVDGAHAFGMLPLDLSAIGAAFYTANAHKWICAPKGSAFLWVREDWRDRVRPAVISHGANSARSDRSRLHLEFDWTGTFDPSAWLSLPATIDAMASMHEGGWPGVMSRNRSLALEGRSILCEALRIEPPAPDSMIGAIASVPLPQGTQMELKTALYGDPLQDGLRERHSIEVPIAPWPAPPNRVLRISAQLYNERSDYEALAEALLEELEREGDRGSGD
ncbi:MAG: aminotransferase class V-fold PLP-dependent enzyme, partial [Thermoanaerobaculia bacterium]|nr:aminotransferase class V-fold PLP-dependent enzyme [Thermoanaerobaculia bacterium]